MKWRNTHVVIVKVVAYRWKLSAYTSLDGPLTCNVAAGSETYLSDGDEIAIDSQDGSCWTVCDQSGDDIGDGGGAESSTCDSASIESRGRRDNGDSDGSARTGSRGRGYSSTRGNRAVRSSDGCLSGDTGGKGSGNGKY